MPIELKMPALSPTMEEGTLAKWLVKEGDEVASGDILAEIETDKATMEFEAVDEGKVAKILVPEGTDGVKVGQPIAILAGEGEDANSAAAEAPKKSSPPAGEGGAAKAAEGEGAAGPAPSPPKAPPASTPPHPAQAAPEQPVGHAGGVPTAAAPSPARGEGGRVKASPLAKRIAAEKGIDLSSVQGSGPGGRIVKADLEAAPAKAEAPARAAPAAATPAEPGEIPHEVVKLSNMRKTIARRLTEAKQTIPHYYLTVDIQLDALLKLRSELNKGLEPRGIKLSVNDLLIKALAMALIEVPTANVSFGGDHMVEYKRADISVAVATEGGLITPIIVGADTKSVSTIATEMVDLAGRAREGKLQPHEYQGGTASISNLGMFGTKQFDAVINPPQGMIMAVGAGEKRPYVINDSLQIATVMSASGSFDHRAIDGAEGAKLMAAFKRLVENPLGMLA
jgi:pyruvate dehydrogenase E2 component (dihydrolipoamide acetyltransferase)